MPRRAKVIPRVCLAVCAGLMLVESVSGQTISWKNSFTFYGDNTEFFNAYRKGETILGTFFSSYLHVELGTEFILMAGVFGNYRSGSERFLESFLPVLSFRYQGAHSLGVMGMLHTVRRHGYLDALQVSTLEFTRPVEYGLQWVERRGFLDVDAFLNWQKLNTPESREVIDFGVVSTVPLISGVELALQFHGLHRGGQLFSAGQPVTNNTAGGPGLRVRLDVPSLFPATFEVYRLYSKGHIEPDVPPDRPETGHGTLLRLEVNPGAWEVWGISWWGHNYLAEEGDNHYNSRGWDPSFYREDRRYSELGVARTFSLTPEVTIRGQFRLHLIDDSTPQALFGTDLQFSYRLEIVAPFEVPLR